jgi:hypothetical protein
MMRHHAGTTKRAKKKIKSLGLVDNGVIGTGLYETSVQSGLGSLALPFEDALADVLAPWVEDSACTFSEPLFYNHQIDMRRPCSCVKNVENPVRILFSGPCRRRRKTR